MLSKHLQDAVENNQNDSASIAPISETDAKIINTLINIFGFIYYEELREIFEDYKKVPDEETLYKLRLWIQNGPSARKVMIKLGDKEFNIQFLQSISLIDSYDSTNQCPVYKIIINKDESEKLLFANTEIVFYSRSKRDQELSEFKEKTKFIQIKYI